MLDALGSTNLVSGLNFSGSGAWDYSDYYPYGGEWAHQSAIGNHYKFTGKERDPESNLDDSSARFYSSNLGRFTSPDPGNAGASLDTPQSWNAYSYVLNNPLNATDPFGLDCIYIDNDTGKQTDFNRGDCDNSTEERANSGYYVDGTVNQSSISFTPDNNAMVYSYTSENQPDQQIGVVCLGDCSSYTVRVNTTSPDATTMSADTSPLTPFQRSLLPPPQIPLSFQERLAIAVGCTSGLDAELMAPMSEPSNGNDKPESKLAEGKYKVPFMRGIRGRPPEMNRSGKSSAEAMNAAAGGFALVGNQQACLQNASGQR